MSDYNFMLTNLLMMSVTMFAFLELTRFSGGLDDLHFGFLLLGLLYSVVWPIGLVSVVLVWLSELGDRGKLDFIDNGLARVGKVFSTCVGVLFKERSFKKG